MDFGLFEEYVVFWSECGTEFYKRLRGVASAETRSGHFAYFLESSINQKLRYIEHM